MMCYVLLPGHQRQCHSSGGLENKGSEECLCNYKRLFIRSIFIYCWVGQNGRSIMCARLCVLLHLLASARAPVASTTNFTESFLQLFVHFFNC